jgi:hypothetical protein
VSSTVIGARMSKRELAIVAVISKIPDATVSELTLYAYQLFLGNTHDQARDYVLSRRNSPLENPTATEQMVSVRLPADIVKAARDKTPDLNTATAHRYILARATTDDDSEALALAVRKPGRPRKEIAA